MLYVDGFFNAPMVRGSIRLSVRFEIEDLGANVLLTIPGEPDRVFRTEDDAREYFFGYMDSDKFVRLSDIAYRAAERADFRKVPFN